MKFCDALIPGLILTLAAAAAAQNDDNLNDPRTPYYGHSGSTLILLLARPSVTEELRLDESESKTLLASLREIDPTHSSFRTPEERQKFRTIRDETIRKSVAAIQKSLSEQQFLRFQQLEAQYLGGRALLNPKIAEQLALTDEQHEKLKPIIKEFGVTGGPGAPRLSEEQAAVRVEKYKTDLLAVLTPEQMNEWQAMTGAPFKVPKSFSGPSWRLVLLPEVQQELGLSEAGAATLAQSLAQVQKEQGRLMFAGRAPANGIDQSQQIIDAVRSSLAVSQWNRLQELILQENGVESLAHHEVAKHLGLNQEQRDRIREAISEYRRRQSDEFRRGAPVSTDELQTRRQQQQANLLDILTKDQKQQWEAMQGAKVDLDSMRRTRISPAAE